jgi:hypothetical protein
MQIMTANGWRPLAPSCQNEIWSISTWDANVRRHVPDQKGGSLNYITTAIGAACEPKPYDGPIPSIDCQEYVKRLALDHNEWLERRAALAA